MIGLAWISLAALVLVIVLSCTTSSIQVGTALAFAWVIGIYVAPFWGRDFTINLIMAGFPTDLFLTLVGVTYCWPARSGTLDRVVRWALQGCRGNKGLMPIVFFGLSLSVASIGAGNIAAAALIGPLAMWVADRAGISPFLMTLMVAHGCVAAPFHPSLLPGIIANRLMAGGGEMGFRGRTTCTTCWPTRLSQAWVILPLAAGDSSASVMMIRQPTARATLPT